MIQELYPLIVSAQKELGERINIDFKLDNGDLKTIIHTLGRKNILGSAFLISEKTIKEAINIDGVFRQSFDKAVTHIKNRMKEEGKYERQLEHS